MKKLLFSGALLLTFLVNAQSSDYPLGHPAYLHLDKFSAQSGSRLWTKIKPYSRQKAIDAIGSKEDFRFDYMRLDSREWSGDSTLSKRPFGRFYRYRTDLYAVEDEGFDLHVNPVMHFRVGKDSNLGSMLFENNRGMEFRARIDDRIALYSMISENQTLFPDYINQYRMRNGAIPGEGFWKAYGDNGATDFFRAEGYLDVGATEHVSVQVGFGRHFIGDGQRSLILSDFGNRYPYVRLETEVWKIKYTNLFAQLVGEAAYDPDGNLGNEEFPQKFMAMHHLDINVTDNLNVGFFESVIFGEPDSLGGGVKLQYLNPVIFYRALEQQDGSPDNVIIGMDFNWDLWQTLTLYGQLVIDEMIFSEVFSGDQWVGNKQGYQLGAKYFDAFGIENLMLQGELNAVRPYVYAHSDFFTNYTHYNMPLAHPQGANFRELIGKVDYWVSPKWRVQCIGVLSAFGDDKDELNYGGNIFNSYEIRPSEYGNAWLQGARKDLRIFNARASYHFKPNLFLEADFMIRNQTDHEQSSIFGLAMRWNFPERFYLF